MTRTYNEQIEAVTIGTAPSRRRTGIARATAFLGAAGVVLGAQLTGAPAASAAPAVTGNPETSSLNNFPCSSVMPHPKEGGGIALELRPVLNSRGDREALVAHHGEEPPAGVARFRDGHSENFEFSDNSGCKSGTGRIVHSAYFQARKGEVVSVSVPSAGLSFP